MVDQDIDRLWYPSPCAELVASSNDEDSKKNPKIVNKVRLINRHPPDTPKNFDFVRRLFTGYQETFY